MLNQIKYLVEQLAKSQKELTTIPEKPQKEIKDLE